MYANVFEVGHRAAVFTLCVSCAFADAFDVSEVNGADNYYRCVQIVSVVDRVHRSNSVRGSM